MFSSGYGFVVDYLAEILRNAAQSRLLGPLQGALLPLLRYLDARPHGINKTFSGLMKILFPHGGATNEEVEELLRFAIEGRKRVKDQLMRIDSTYAEVHFGYQDAWRCEWQFR
jgi:ATP-dependent Lon protease